MVTVPSPSNIPAHQASSSVSTRQLLLAQPGHDRCWHLAILVGHGDLRREPFADRSVVWQDHVAHELLLERGDAGLHRFELRLDHEYQCAPALAFLLGAHRKLTTAFPPSQP